MNKDALVSQLIMDEGERLYPYKDTVEKWTIGVGRNLTDVGVSREESAFMLNNDLLHVEASLNHLLPWWVKLPESAQQGLANMCFNLGITGLMQFHLTLAHLEQGQFSEAATSVLDSKWAKQVGARAVRIANQFKGEG